MMRKGEKDINMFIYMFLASCSLTDVEKQVQKEQHGIFMHGDTCKKS